ncbi:MAG: type VI secretion system tube protein TssD [Bacillota bacterium]
MFRTYIRHLAGVLVALLVLALLPQAAEAGLMANLWVTAGDTPIEGSASKKGRAGGIDCHAVDQTILMPKSGAGGPVLAPLTCVKPLDQATPLLMKAMLEQQSLVVKLKFYAIHPSSQEIELLTITLEDARVISQRLVLDHIRDVQNDQRDAQEEVSFTYRTITWTYHLSPVPVSYTYTATGEPETTVPPATIALNGEAWDGNVYLRWQAATPPAGRKLLGYHVYRSDMQDGLFDRANRVTVTPLNTERYTDMSVDAGTYFYGVQAIWDDGSIGAVTEPMLVEVQ